MLRAIRTITCGLGLMAATVTGNAYADDNMDTLNFGIISTESQQNLKAMWDPFLADMSKDLAWK